MSGTSGATLTPVLIADDEELVRIGIRAILLRHSEDWRIVSEAATVEGTVEAARCYRPVLAILDQCLPGGASLRRGEGVPELCRELSDQGVAVVVYTESGGSLLNRFYQRAGVMAAVGKNLAVGTFMRAIETAARGERFFASARLTPEAEREERGLTPRQAEIIRLLALGHSNPEIASECGMSVRTVESHRARIRRQIGLDSLSELTRFALDHGIIC